MRDASLKDDYGGLQDSAYLSNVESLRDIENVIAIPPSSFQAG